MVYIRRTHVILFTARLPLFYRRRDPHLRQAALLPPESATLQCQSGTWRHSSATWRRRQVARRDQAHSQKHDAKKDFEREKEEKRRFDDELSYFFVNLPKRRKRTKRRRHPAYADTQKGGCKTHIARMSVSHGTLCRHSRHLRTEDDAHACTTSMTMTAGRQGSMTEKDIHIN